MSNNVVIDDMVSSVDEIYEAMDKGNKQHMINKLFKHGWFPQKAWQWVTEEDRDLLQSILEAVQINEAVPFANETMAREGDKVYVYEPYNENWHNMEYLVARVFVNDDIASELRLINTDTGSQWARDSLFGSHEFTTKPTKGKYDV